MSLTEIDLIAHAVNCECHGLGAGGVVVVEIANQEDLHPLCHFGFTFDSPEYLVAKLERQMLDQQILNSNVNFRITKPALRFWAGCRRSVEARGLDMLTVLTPSS